MDDLGDSGSFSERFQTNENMKHDRIIKLFDAWNVLDEKYVDSNTLNFDDQKDLLSKHIRSQEYSIPNQNVYDKRNLGDSMISIWYKQYIANKVKTDNVLNQQQYSIHKYFDELKDAEWISYYSELNQLLNPFLLEMSRCAGMPDSKSSKEKKDENMLSSYKLIQDIENGVYDTRQIEKIIKGYECEKPGQLCRNMGKYGIPAVAQVEEDRRMGISIDPNQLVISLSMRSRCKCSPLCKGADWQGRTEEIRCLNSTGSNINNDPQIVESKSCGFYCNTSVTQQEVTVNGNCTLQELHDALFCVNKSDCKWGFIGRFFIEGVEYHNDPRPAVMTACGINESNEGNHVVCIEHKNTSNNSPILGETVLFNHVGEVASDDQSASTCVRSHAVANTGATSCGEAERSTVDLEVSPGKPKSKNTKQFRISEEHNTLKIISDNTEGDVQTSSSICTNNRPKLKATGTNSRSRSRSKLPSSHHADQYAAKFRILNRTENDTAKHDQLDSESESDAEVGAGGIEKLTKKRKLNRDILKTAPIFKAPTIGKGITSNSKPAISDPVAGAPPIASNDTAPRNGLSIRFIEMLHNSKVKLGKVYTYTHSLCCNSDECDSVGISKEDYQCGHDIYVTDICYQSNPTKPIHPKHVDVTYLAQSSHRKCDICNKCNADLITYNDRCCVSNPTFFCTICYHMLHYTASEGTDEQPYSLLYNDFNVYKYKQEMK